MKKKVLHLISGLEVGGTEMMLLKTLPHLQSDCLENQVCCLRGHGEIGKKLEEAGIKVHYLEVTNPFQLIRFRQIVKNFCPDMLVTYLIHADLIGRVLGRIFSIKKIVCSQRGSLLNWEFLRFFDRLTKFLVTKYIVQTGIAKKDLMLKLGLPDDKFSVIPNSIDPDEFNIKINTEEKKRELSISYTNYINISCVSNLRKGKGHTYLLEAFNNIYKKNTNINLLIIGAGELKNKLLEQIENYESRNNIYFLGKRNDVKEILKISDIFILPTLAEGMSNAIMEAMAMGLPIITTNISVNKELIEEDKTGILIPVRNVDAIENSLNNLINDASLRIKLGKNARQKISDEFDVKIVTRKLSNLLEKI